MFNPFKLVSLKRLKKRLYILENESAAAIDSLVDIKELELEVLINNLEPEDLELFNKLVNNTELNEVLTKIIECSNIRCFSKEIESRESMPLATRIMRYMSD